MNMLKIGYTQFVFPVNQGKRAGRYEYITRVSLFCQISQSTTIRDFGHLAEWLDTLVISIQNPDNTVFPLPSTVSKIFLSSTARCPAVMQGILCFIALAEMVEKDLLSVL